jgi:hypothetical protein
MRKLKDYLNGWEIKPNLNQKELLELKELLKNLEEKDKKALETRTRECYL